MDPSSQALRKVRDEVIESRAWSKLQRELLMQIHHLEYLAGEGQLRTFNSLTTREKLAAVERAVKELGDTPAYAKLQTKIGAAVDQHFSSLVFNPLAPPQTTQQATSSSSVHVPSRAGRDGEQQASSFNRPLAEACSILLQESPHLKHSLKNALNHPLPSTLRLPAWKLLLQYPAVQKDFMVTAKNMQPRNAEERAISERCQSILSSHLVFRDIAEGDTNLLAMQSVMLYWKQRTSVSVLDSEFLLCVPFIHVWREELDRQVGEGKGEGWLLFAEIAGEYVNFMEMLPPSIGSAVGRESADGMRKFSQRVEELLHAEDPLLYKALQKLFKKAATGSSRSSHRRRSGSGPEPFHRALSNVLYSHIQRMLVGDLAMEVLCYIWDQCFMGLDVPEYQCLPYFTTVWLILLRDRLLKATSIEAVEEALSVHSLSLRTTQFQQEIENRFLPHLSSLLRVKPLPLHPTHPHPFPPPQSHPPHPHASHRPSSHPPHLSNAHPFHSLPRGRGQSTPHTSSGRVNAEMDLQRKLEEMQQKVEKEQRVLSHRIREEREQHQKQLEVFRKELGEIKIGFSGGPKKKQSVIQDQSMRSLTPTAIHRSPSKQPTLDAGRVSSIGSNKSGRVQDMRSVQVIPVNPSSQQWVVIMHATLSDDGRRPFSPAHLSKNDVQALWLKVLHKFTTAAYTICHGTGSERQDLFSTLHFSTPTES